MSDVPKWQRCDPGDFFGVGNCSCTPRPAGGWAMKADCAVHAKYLAPKIANGRRTV